MGRALLWHLPISHFSEKVRWALESFDGRRIADSTAIIEWLEARYPDWPALYPAGR